MNDNAGLKMKSRTVGFIYLAVIVPILVLMLPVGLIKGMVWYFWLLTAICIPIDFVLSWGVVKYSEKVGWKEAWKILNAFNG